MHMDPSSKVVTALLLLVSAVFPMLAAFIYRRALRYRPLIPGSVALITGGGSGMGLEFARYFARAGCYVVLVGRNASALATAQALCIASGSPGVEVIVADLSTAEGTKKVGTSLRTLLDGTTWTGHLKYLVLNAGLGAILPFSGDPFFYSICEALMQINYFANVRLLQELLPALEATHSSDSPSRIVVVSSLAGVLPSILRSGYTASKHAIQGFVNALRGETDVLITLFCPGYVDTDFHLKAAQNTTPGTCEASHRRGMSPSAAVEECMNGVLGGDAEVLTPFVGRLGYVLRPLFTRLVDSRAKKVSLRSLQR
uniref:Uncharacterized protein TCIL3000_11_10540 n=1 Tax=Trypanosoma congolense (strain IL3000) TaxID=1068625 RepID=G0V1R0_TRYCI|nr:unnamed protein product [Trypanosoma congolense IL3000]